MVWVCVCVCVSLCVCVTALFIYPCISKLRDYLELHCPISQPLATCGYWALRMYSKYTMHTRIQRLKYGKKVKWNSSLIIFIFTVCWNDTMFGIWGWIKHIIKLIFTCFFLCFFEAVSTRKFQITSVDHVLFLLGRAALDRTKIGYSINEMVWDPREKFSESHIISGVAVWLGLPGAVLVQACCLAIIINSVPTNSQRCPCVDDKLCGTLHIALSSLLLFALW